MYIKQDIPIWATDWTFEHQKTGTRFTVKDISTKCESQAFALTNKHSVRSALKFIKASPTTKKHLRPISVNLKKQIGSGKYEKHEIYNPEEK